MDKPYDSNFTGVLFKNDKGNNEKRPDYRGSCVINNVDFNVSGWIRSSKKTGDKYMSLRFEPKTAVVKAKPAKAQMTTENWDDLDTPF